MTEDNTKNEAPTRADFRVEHSKEMENAEEYELTVTEESLMRLHGLSLTLPLPCDLCPIGTVFDNLDEFDAHMSEHPEAKMFACQLCSNTYKSWSNLVAHRKMFHFGEVLSCERCGTRKSHARLEGSVHYPVGDKPHGCEECEIGLDTISDVYRHYFFHKAPPGGSRRRGGNNFGPLQRRGFAAQTGIGSRSQGGKVKSDTLQGPSGTSASNWSGNHKRNTVGTPVANLSGNLIDSLVFAPSNGIHGNLTVSPSVNVADVSSDGTLVGNLQGIQNGSLIGNVITIPSGNLVEDLPGVKIENLIVKPAGIQGEIIEGNLHGIQGGSLIMKPVKICGGDMNLNSPGIQSDNLNVNESVLPSENSSEDITGIMTGSVTVIQSHSSTIPPTGTRGEISNKVFLENQIGPENNKTPIDIPGENMEIYLAEEPNRGLENRDGKSQTLGQKGVLIPMSPKGGLVKVIGDSDEPSSDPLMEPSQLNKVTVSYKHFCPHCPFTCAKLGEYREHLVSGAKAHDCVMCSGTHLKRMSLTDHEYCQSHTRQFKCIPCKTTLQSEGEFEAHLRDRHTAGYLPCCLCGRKFNRLVYVEHIKSCQHKRIEWEFRKQLRCKTCEPCGKLFHSAGALRRHMKRHEVNRKLTYDCKTCGRTFQHGGAYAKHLWANPSHGPPEQRAKIPGKCTNYICEKCGKTFSKREGLRCHLMRHEGVRPHACSSCPKSFVTRTSLVIHVRQHTGERPYMCEMCGKNFTGPTSLYVHQRKHRVGDDGRGGGGIGGGGSVVIRKAAMVAKKPKTKHTCPVCGKTLSSKLIFEGHIRQHTGERPFVCETCGRGFSTAKIMRLHAKRHDREMKGLQEVKWVQDVGVKPVVDIEGGLDSNSPSTCIFLCPRCGLGLVSSDELGDHMARGDCVSGGTEMFVLPMTNESECIDTGSMVDVD